MNAIASIPRIHVTAIMNNHDNGYFIISAGSPFLIFPPLIIPLSGLIEME